MNPVDYDYKMMDFLMSSNAKFVKFNFNHYDALGRKLTSESEFIIEKRFKYSLKIPNPRPPSLYGLPKIHKSDSQK